MGIQVCRKVHGTKSWPQPYTALQLNTITLGVSHILGLTLTINFHKVFFINFPMVLLQQVPYARDVTVRLNPHHAVVGRLFFLARSAHCRLPDHIRHSSYEHPQIRKTSELFLRYK